MLAEFKRYFDHLQDDIRSKGGEVLLGGDFNSKSWEWGEEMENNGCQILTKWFAQNDFAIRNAGQRSTF
jgi:hypothetical protein